MASEAYIEQVGGRNVHPISKRGTRWPANQAVPADWISLGYEIREKAGLPRIDLHLEADKFSDHFAGMNGARAIKLNWLATWRNWCRNSYSGKPEEKPTKPGFSDMIAQSRARARLAASGIRSSYLDAQDIRIGLEWGDITPEQARRLGF
jgi:hypothetical protein